MSDHDDGSRAVRTLDRERLASLWQDTSFSDVILVVEGSQEEPRQTTLRIPAHKAVLAAASPYFHKMFTSASFTEKNKWEVPLKSDNISLDPGSVEAILCYIYTGVKIPLSQDNAQSLLEAASYLEVTLVMEQTSQFFEANLENFEDVMDIRNLAESNGCTDLVAAVDLFVEDNFLKITDSAEFLEYSFENVEALISLDNLRDLFRGISEKDIFNAVLKWIKHDFESRSSNIEMLFGKLRISRLTADFIEDTVKPFLGANRGLSCLRNHENTAGEDAHSDETVIIALVKYYPENEHENLETYLQFLDFEKKKWISLVKIPQEVGALLGIDNYVALYDTNRTSKALLYNFKTGKLSQMKINIPTDNKLVALEGRVYAVGLRGSDRSAKVMEHDGWKIGASMSMKRPGASVVAHDGKIYVFGGGGHSINSFERTTTAEVYDPVKDEWESIPPMFTARTSAGAASLGGKIFVVGGFGVAYEHLSCGECYDPKTKMWTKIPHMIEAEADIDAVANDGALFVADPCADDVEKYSPECNTWEKVKVESATEKDFEFWALCTLNKKLFAENPFVNMNNNK